MKSIPLTEADITKIRNSFTYDEFTGLIKRIPVPGVYISTSCKRGVNNSPTARVELAEGRTVNMPTPRLAYVLAFGKEPTGRVSLDKKPSGSTESPDLRKENLRLPGQKTPRVNIRSTLSPQDIKHLRSLFLYDEESGIISKNPDRWPNSSPARWYGLNNHARITYSSLDCVQREIATPRLAYVLAYGLEPMGVVSVIVYPKSGFDPLDLRKKNLRIA
jgi:hypothetical protein